jgi:RNA polymerase sigma factor (sigma-70 family)
MLTCASILNSPAVADGPAAEGRDVAALYGALGERLEQIVRADVRAPDVVVEDACQFAWSQLLRHRERVSADGVLSWLAKTAVHEALKLIRRQQRDLPLDELLEPAQERTQATEIIDLLDALASLPLRQQRLLWLHALGLTYVEMAGHEGCTRRTVERQLLRAKHTVRAAYAQ